VALRLLPYDQTATPCRVDGDIDGRQGFLLGIAIREAPHELLEFRRSGRARDTQVNDGFGDRCLGIRRLRDGLGHDGLWREPRLTSNVLAIVV